MRIKIIQFLIKLEFTLLTTLLSIIQQVTQEIQTLYYFKSYYIHAQARVKSLQSCCKHNPLHAFRIEYLSQTNL